jgi:anti-sigma regulatory factor (Ser/Thr protein kinase)
VDLPADAKAPAVARDEIVGAVSGVLPPERLDALRIAVSEVVTNAVRHGSVREQTIGIDLRVRPDFIRVTVTQEEPAFRRPAAPAPSASGEGGFGLPLLEALSDRWDVDAGPPPSVWFEMDVE